MISIPVPEDLSSLRLAKLDHRRLPDDRGSWTAWITESEKEEWQRLSHPGRQAEWLGVRLCLKQIACAADERVHPWELTVEKDVRGRPRLVRRDQPDEPWGDCSLAHAGSWSLAAWTVDREQRIGVDIERISPRLQRAAGAFVSVRDGAAVERDELEQLAIWWCLKEACAKAIGQGLGAGLAEIACRETEPGRHRLRHAGGPEWDAWHLTSDDFVQAVCMSAART